MKNTSGYLNNILLTILIMVFPLSISFAQQAKFIKKGTWKNQQIEYRSNQIAIKLKTGITIQDMKPLLSKFNSEIIGSFNKLGWGVIEIPQDSDAISFIDKLKGNVFFETVEPNMVHKVQFDPNDPYYNTYQWNMKNTGQASPNGVGYGTPGADINADSAWNITQGSSSIIIAILDTGIPLDATTYSLDHPDLNDTNKFILGPNETDDWNGVRDNNGHGSHVTGIASAMTNNGVGVAGVAGGCKVMVIKAFDSSGVGYSMWFQNGIIYAVDNGAKIINYSGGSPTGDSCEIDGIYYANSHNVLICAAAGNNFGDSVIYPAAYSLSYPNLIAVGSTTNHDSVSDFSNVGAELTVVAPGSDIYSTIPTYSTEYSVTHGGTVNYAQFWGTSMATPHVTGTAALILAINPNLTLSQVKQILINTTKKVAGMNGQSFTTSYGYGRINAYNALKYTLENYGGTLTQNITIPAGDNWTFQPGVTLSFGSGDSLKVNGIMTISGTTSSPLVLNFSGTGGLVFSGSTSSSSSLSYVTINNGAGISCLNGANPTIQNSTLNNCTQGIYIYNASPSIVNNQIMNPSQNGIYIDGSSSTPGIYSNLIKRTTGQSYQGIFIVNNNTSYISHNRIGGFMYGIYIGGGSVARLQGSGYAFQNNLISNNYVGLCAGWGSTIYGGYQGNGMYNSIHGNTDYDADSYEYSNLYAEYAYWGSSPKRYVDNTSTLDYNNALSTDPWYGASPSIQQKDKSYSANTLASVAIPNPTVLIVKASPNTIFRNKTNFMVSKNSVLFFPLNRYL
jgi:subtilisin family serine protease